jgi:hypothetical protein
LLLLLGPPALLLLPAIKASPVTVGSDGEGSASAAKGGPS